MTLHRQLTKAFGRPDSSSLKNIGEPSPPEEGYFWRKIDFSIILNSSGDWLDVEQPPWRSGGKRRRNTLLVPHKQLGSASASSGFLWGQSTHALGIGSSKQSGFKANPDGFRRFRTFHRATLGAAQNPSIRAFLLFIQRWNPETPPDPAMAAQIAGSSVVFRFNYEDCFLHENYAARLIWARLFKPAGSQPQPDAERDPSHE
jgi:hypothetical protein